MSNNQMHFLERQCMTPNCGKTIKITKGPQDTKWQKFEMDEVTRHVCNNKKPQQQHTQTPQQQQSNNRLDRNAEILTLLRRAVQLLEQNNVS